MAPKRSRAGHQRKGRRLIRLKTFDAMDGRTHAVLRAKQFMGDILSDLGGQDNVTSAERQIVQHASVLAAVLEHHECQWLAGEEVNVNEYLAGVNCQRRLLEAVGLQRRSKDVTPSLTTYLAEKATRGGSEEPGAVAAVADTRSTNLRNSKPQSPAQLRAAKTQFWKSSPKNPASKNSSNEGSSE